MENRTYNNAASPEKISEKILGKSLPFSVEAERSVLGSLMLYDSQLPVVMELLNSNDFYTPAHRAIYEAMVSISAKNQRIDLVMLQEQLDKTAKLESIGGINYLLSIAEDIPAIGLIEQHARIIKEKSTLRDLISTATTIIASCYKQQGKELDAILDEAERSIFQISKQKTNQSFVQLNIWLRKTFQHLSDIKAHNKGITGISTGYRKLDEMTSGFQSSDLIILAARPAMGKTALALSLVRTAILQNKTVGFFSLEMSAEQLTLRLLSAQSRISHYKIRNAMVNSDEFLELTRVSSELAGLKLFIDDTAASSIMEIRTKARKLKLEQNLDFLVVDYLQLLHGHKKYENRHQEVSEISRSLKALAKELNIPILALSQLSRAVDSRIDKRPMLSDLRESGAIEQDADVIMFLYRDVVYHQDTENPNLAEVIVGKQRNGPTGFVSLLYQNDITLFEDER